MMQGEQKIFISGVFRFVAFGNTQGCQGFQIARCTKPVEVVSISNCRLSMGTLLGPNFSTTRPTGRHEMLNKWQRLIVVLQRHDMNSSTGRLVVSLLPLKACVYPTVPCHTKWIERCIGNIIFVLHSTDSQWRQDSLTV